MGGRERRWVLREGRRVDYFRGKGLLSPSYTPRPHRDPETLTPLSRQREWDGDRLGPETDAPATLLEGRTPGTRRPKGVPTVVCGRRGSRWSSPSHGDPTRPPSSPSDRFPRRDRLRLGSDRVSDVTTDAPSVLPPHGPPRRCISGAETTHGVLDLGVCPA